MIVFSLKCYSDVKYIFVKLHLMLKFNIDREYFALKYNSGFFLVPYNFRMY